MLEELVRDVLVARARGRQLEGDREQIQAVHAHPARRVGLLEEPTLRQRIRAIEHTDVVEPEEASLEDVVARGVLAVDPPGEVQHQLQEHRLEKIVIRLACSLAIDLEHAERRPRVHWRVDVPEGPLVRGELPVRMHVPFTRQQNELLLREIRVDDRQGDAVEREVPCRVPGVLPLVRHAEHLAVEEVPPLTIAPALALRRRSRSARIAAQPAIDVERVVLLRPEQPGQRLALHACGLR